MKLRKNDQSTTIPKIPLISPTMARIALAMANARTIVTAYNWIDVE